MKFRIPSREQIGKLLSTIRSCVPVLKADIARGLSRDEFLPVFQPLVELRTGQLTGFEVLARWNHRRLGLLTPADFIPAVEKSGLIDGMTTAILKRLSCHQCWPAARSD
jgi:EAL domain-containing protein (putative c-di-GMP-specific phosphodiesterase class I)